MQDGSDLTIISTGGVLGIAIEAASKLERAGHSTRLLSMPILVPLDADAISNAAHETKAILTVEEHGIGGLGTMTAEVLTSTRTGIPFHAVRLGRDPIRVAGTQEELRSSQGVSVEGIVAAAEKLLGSRPTSSPGRSA